MNLLPFYIQLSAINPAFQGGPQEFAEHLVERLRIVGLANFYGIVVSDTEPTSNMGMWLKGGKKPYVWDNTLPGYVPIDLSDSLVSVLAILADLTSKLTLGRIIFSDTEPVYSVGPPVVDNRTGVLWVKTQSGAALGLYTWNGVKWARVGSPPNVVVPTGTGVTYTGTANDPDVTSYSDLVNRLMVFIPHTDNVGASVLNYQSLGDKAFRKQGSKPLESGDLKAGMSTVIVYDGTYWQVLTPTYSAALPPVFTRSYQSPEIDIGVAGTSGTAVAHGLTQRPTLVFGKLICKVTEFGVPIETELPLGDFTWHRVDSSNDSGGTAPIQLHADTTNITPVWCFNGSSNDILFKPATSGNWVAITPSRWKLKIVAIA